MQASMTGQMVFGGTFMLAWASLFGSIGVFSFLRRRKRQMRGCAACGIIVGEKQSRHRGEADTYRPEVEFRTARGETVTFLGATGSGQRPRLGRKVRVVYYPEDPEDAAILSFGDIWVMPLLFMVICAGCLTLSILSYSGFLENPQ